MKHNVIIGGGMAGLLAAKALQSKGIAFLGLEETERLGGHIQAGHRRLYEEASLNQLGGFFEDLSWKLINEPPMERKKGEWVALKSDYPKETNYYLGDRYFSPDPPYQTLIQQLISSLGSFFKTRKKVVKILENEKMIQCDDGSHYEFNKLIWCTGLSGLVQIWEGPNKKFLLKHQRKWSQCYGGINLDMELKARLFSHKNTVLYSFRFKDKRFHALGIADSKADGRETIHWILFLEKPILDNREEVAKSVRALKRELRKEFPELEKLIASEKLTYMPTIAYANTTALKNPMIMPDVYYVGSQVSLPDSQEDLQNLDRTIENFRVFTKEAGNASW